MELGKIIIVFTSIKIGVYKPSNCSAPSFIINRRGSVSKTPNKYDVANKGNPVDTNLTISGK
jgi:hypothetical protein